MIKADPKTPLIAPSKIPHGRHGPKQVNPCLKYNSKSQPITENPSLPDKDSPNLPMITPTPPSSKSDYISPSTTLCKIPQHRHGPKQGNTCSNYKSIFQPKPVKRTHSEKFHLNPPTSPLPPPPTTKPSPKLPVITPRKSPYRSLGPKQGNLYQNSNTKSHSLLEKTTQLAKNPSNPPINPPTYPSIKPDPKSTYSYPCNIPHGS